MVERQLLMSRMILFTNDGHVGFPEIRFEVRSFRRYFTTVSPSIAPLINHNKNDETNYSFIRIPIFNVLHFESFDGSLIYFLLEI